MLEMQEAADTKNVELALTYEPFRRAVKEVIQKTPQKEKPKKSETYNSLTAQVKPKNFGDHVVPESELF